jgi:hypothetical protein
MTSYLRIIIVFLTFSACGQKTLNMENKDILNSKFTEFIEKKKFIEEGLYPGIADQEMRPIFSKKINDIAVNFQKAANSDAPTIEKFQEQIKIGLLSYKEVYLDLDTEDRERVCTYFEELMDIVGLRSSNGQLNDFMYGYNFQ